MKWISAPLMLGRRAGQMSGLLVAVIGGSAIIGWETGRTALGSLSASSPPMAPTTALSVVVVGLAIGFLPKGGGRHWSLSVIRTGALCVATVALVRLAEIFSGLDVNIDRRIVFVSTGGTGAGPVPHMHFFTAICILLVCSSLLIMTLQHRRLLFDDLSGTLAILVSSLGLAFILGYAVDAPLFSGHETLPMALNSALAFLVLGGGILLSLSFKGEDEGKAPGTIGLRVPIDRKILGGFGLAAAAVIVVAMVSLHIMFQFVESTRLVAHTRVVIADLESIATATSDIGSGARAFALTGDTRFLEPYQSAILRIHGLVGHVRELTADNVSQLVRLRLLDSLIADQLRFHAHVVSLRQERGLEAAAALVATGLGQHAMDSARKGVTDMTTVENGLLAERSGKRQAAISSTIVVFSSLIGLLLAILIGIYMVIRRELGNRQMAEEEVRNTKNLLDSIIENIPAMIFVKDAAELRFVRFNKAGEKLTGYSSQEFLGKNDYDLFPAEEADHFTTADREVLQGNMLLDIPEEPLQTRDNGVRILHTRKIALLDAGGTPQYLLGISEDITETKKAREQIIALNTDLDRRATSLEIANKELEAFSYSVSHDLRAPLRHISGFSDLLSRNAHDLLDDTARRYIKTISEAARQMGELIDDLLVFSRMGRMEMRNSLVNTAQLVQALIDRIIEGIGSRSIDWHIGTLPDVNADPAMLRLVFENLIANAVKYTRTKPKARIDISCENRPDEVIFSVRDNGVGFDMRYVHKLFNVFQRLHTSEEFEGTGIGLANVRRIIHRHNGKTWADGEINKGANFFFSLPSTSKG